MLGDITTSQARRFIESSHFVWHQRFELAPGQWTPGISDVGFLLDQSGIPPDLTGQSVLDVGTANGGCAFEVERRGAARVVAVDLYPPDWFGFSQLKELCHSKVEFQQSSIYELPEHLVEQFDLVLCFGVLYHLRHPLLALDRLREMTRGQIAIETAVCDHENSALESGPYVRFYRQKELAGDGSNWFAPSTPALLDWVTSCGFSVSKWSRWPEIAAERAMVTARRLTDPPEYQTLSYERPIVSLRTARG